MGQWGWWVQTPRRGSHSCDALLIDLQVLSVPLQDAKSSGELTVSADKSCLWETVRVTCFLQDAKSMGKLTVSGLEMFVGQAAQQFTLFTGKEAPLDLMRKAVLDSLNS